MQKHLVFWTFSIYLYRQLATTNVQKKTTNISTKVEMFKNYRKKKNLKLIYFVFSLKKKEQKQNVFLPFIAFLYFCFSSLHCNCSLHCQTMNGNDDERNIHLILLLAKLKIFFLLNNIQLFPSLHNEGNDRNEVKFSGKIKLFDERVAMNGTSEH